MPFWFREEVHEFVDERRRKIFDVVFGQVDVSKYLSYESIPQFRLELLEEIIVFD
jgi:hypothetical protein